MEYLKVLKVVQLFHIILQDQQLEKIYVPINYLEQTQAFLEQGI